MRRAEESKYDYNYFEINDMSMITSMTTGIQK